MSLEAIAWALRQRVGSPGGKCLLLALANYADDFGFDAGQERLASLTEQSIDSVQRGLAVLAEAGLIERLRRGGNGSGREHDLIFLLLDRSQESLPHAVTYFYAVMSAEHLKVGITRCPADRFGQLRRKRGPLTLLGLWRGDAVTCTRVEQVGLARLATFLQPIGSEWFDMPDAADERIGQTLCDVTMGLIGNRYAEATEAVA